MQYAKGEHTVDGERRRMQGSRARDDAKRATAAATCTEDKSTQTTGRCNTCGVRIGDGEYCAKCSKTDDRLIDGVCVADNTDTKCKAKSVADGTCESCGAGYFLHKGGCYSTDAGKPGRALCTTAGEGVCTQGAEGYFAVPGAAKTGESVVACGDTTGVTVSGNKKCIGVDGCAKCTKPDQLSTAGTKAVTCTECTTPKIVKTAASVTYCVTEAQCKGAERFFVKGQDDSKTCEACDSMCKTCSGGGEADKCTSCKDTGMMYLKKDNPADSTGTCVDAAGCPSTHYIDEEAKTCSACASAGTTGCKTCAKTDGLVACASCEDIQKFGLNKKSCVKDCPANSQAGSDGVCVCNAGLPPTQAPLRALTAIPAALHTVPPMRTATRPAPKAYTS